MRLYKIMNYKQINQALFKIIVLMFIVGLNWTEFSVIGQTFASFNDTETSLENVFQAGTLDFSLSSSGDFSPSYIIPTQATSTRAISIENHGTLGFQYKVSVEKTSGDNAFCEALQLTASLDNEIKYTNSLLGFTSATTTFSNTTDDWIFTVTLNNNDPNLQGKICTFDFVFDGWQKNMDHNTGGFFDTERIESIITAGEWMPNVEITDPDGGEIWFILPDNLSWFCQFLEGLGMNAQCQYPIKWTAENKIGQDADLLIDIYFSTDSGAKWARQIVDNTENDRVYWWKPFINTDYMINNGRIKIVATHKVYSTITNYDISNSDFIVIDFTTISNIRELRESGLLGSFDNVSLDAKLEILINAIPREIPIEQGIYIPESVLNEVQPAPVAEPTPTPTPTSSVPISTSPTSTSTTSTQEIIIDKIIDEIIDEPELEPELELESDIKPDFGDNAIE